MMLRKMPAVLLASALTIVGCDDDDDGGGDGGTGGDDRSATILGLEGDNGAGMTVFSGSCSAESCHGADGVSGMAPSLAGTVPNLSDAQIVSVLLNGKGTMPTQAGLSDQQLADVVAYVGTTFGG